VALLDKLMMGVNLGRGPVATKSARFKVLGNLLAELAVVADLGFRIVQRGHVLVFETFAVHDRTTTIRLDIFNNTLAGHRVTVTPPGATQVLVAGQQEGVDRQFVHLTTPEATAAEQQWGRRIERFVDQRNTDKVDELTQAGMEVLKDEGHTTLGVQAVPMEDSAMRFGHDWNVGDRVAVVVAGQELTAIVTGYTLKANASGFRLGAVIGDPTGLSLGGVTTRRANNVETRVAALERSAGTTTGVEPAPILWTVADFLDPNVTPLYQGDTIRYAVIGGEVRFRGLARITYPDTLTDEVSADAVNAVVNPTLANLPLPLRPTEWQDAIALCAGAPGIGDVEIGADGSMTLIVKGDNPLPYWVSFDTIRYWLI
jgi:hypothetical protein